MKIILASKSPRRREILENLGFEFEVVTCGTDESSDISDGARLAVELSARKAKAVAEMLFKDGKADGQTIVIGCDTVVICGDEILGKPRDRADAERMMRMLSGRGHSVVSGLTLICGDQIISDHAETRVFFDKLTDEDIEDYISSDEPYDKAGGYGIQGKAGLFINRIEGCYYNVVGLPVNLLNRCLKKISSK